MLRQLRTSIKVLLFFTLLVGIIYPGIVTIFAQLVFFEQANGSLIYAKGNPVGSGLLGQKFTQEAYFQGRPSATDYVLSTSGGSNLALKNPELSQQITRRQEELRKAFQVQNIPTDLLYASASGLDPHISVEAAQIQVARVSRARGLKETEVQNLLVKNTQKTYRWLIGRSIVNVTLLNLALDKAESISG